MRGTLVLADLSGFTHLTEQLQERGREGAEEVTDIVNRVLAPMVECVEELSGSVLQFGGDAIFALFQGARHPRRGAQAATELMRVLREYGQMGSSIGPIELEMKVVAATGEIIAFHVDAGEQTVYLHSGEMSQRLERLSKLVRSGEILLDHELAGLLGAVVKADPRGGLLESPVEWHPVNVRGLARPPEASEPLLRYLPPELRPFLRRGPVEGEYRTVATAFVRFAPSSESVAPRDLLDLLTAFFIRLAGILKQFEGKILKSTTSPASDVFLVTFGLPEAHEDDAHRAVLAALAMRDTIDEALPQMRIAVAVHVGVVVAADVGGESRRVFDVMGDDVNLTSRLLESTPWGQVRLTQAVKRLCEQSLRTEALGSYTFRGKDTPVEVFMAGELLQSPAIVPERNLPPFVGREPEMAIINEAVAEAANGRGRVIGIRAEAGGGKSRLWLEVRQMLHSKKLFVHYGTTPSLGGAEGYAVFGDLFRRMMGLASTSHPLDSDLCSRKIREFGLPSGDTLYLRALLGDRSARVGARGAELKAANIRFVRRFISRLVQQGPAVIMLEDLHWADPASVELIELLAEDTESLPLLLLLSYRPSFQHRMSELSHFCEIELAPLDMEAGTRLLEALLEGAHFPFAVARRLVEQSGGIPFFLEEVVRTIKESGWLKREVGGWTLAPGAHVESLPLPDTIDALLSARLHRLPPALKRAVQRAAVIGRSFPKRVLEAVCGEGVERTLEQLREKEILFQLPNQDKGGAGVSEKQLIFKHALIRDVAYYSLLARHRQVLHGKIARALQALYQDDMEKHTERLAWHFAASDSPNKAVPFLLGSARNALSQGRFDDGKRNAEKALLILEQVKDESPEFRFPLLLCRGDSEAWGGDYPKVLATYAEAAAIAPGDAARAEVLGRQAFIFTVLGDFDRSVKCSREGLLLSEKAESKAGQARCLREMGTAYRLNARLTAAMSCFEQALALAEQLEDKVGQALALQGLGATHYEYGDCCEATRHLERALGFALELKDRRGEVQAWVCLARVSTWMGAFGEARERFESAWRLAYDVEDLSSLQLVLLGQFDIDLAQGQIESARTCLVDAFELSRELPDRAANGNVKLCAVKLAAREACWTSALEEAEKVLDFCLEHMGPRAVVSAMNGLLVSALELGRIQQARQWANLAQLRVESCEVPYERTELLVLEGRLRALEGRPDWRNPLDESLREARRMKNPLLEIGAILGLARAAGTLGLERLARKQLERARESSIRLGLSSSKQELSVFGKAVLSSKDG